MTHLAKTPPFGVEPLDPERRELLLTMLMALAEPMRLRIVSLMASAPHGEQAISDLISRLGGLAQPTISHHMAVLRGVGLVECRKDGQFNRYRLVEERLVYLADLLRLLGRELPKTPASAK